MYFHMGHYRKDSSCLGRFQALTNSLPELDQDRSSATLNSIYVLFEIAIKSLASSRSVLKFLGQSVELFRISILISDSFWLR